MGTKPSSKKGAALKRTPSIESALPQLPLSVILEAVPSARFRTRTLIKRAIKEGVRHGYVQAHIPYFRPSKEILCEVVEQSVMNALIKILDFGEVS